MYLTGELSFGSGSARLVYGAATGVLLMSTDTTGGAIPGVAGKFTVSAERGIGLPNVGTLFSASGSVSIMFNTTLRDKTFKIPDAFLPLLHPGEPTEITIYGSAPGLDGQRRSDAPAGGEVYVKATIQAQLTIGGVLTLNGFIGITAAIDPTGTAYFKVDGAVGTTIPFLGSLTGAINLAVYVGARTGVVGRVQLTLGSNSIPGVRFNGQFLLEINTFSTSQQIQTFAVNQSGGRFNGFVRDGAGNLVVTTQTISVTGGFRLEMGGELVIANTLVVSGHVLLTLSLAGPNPELELIVNGTINLAPIGNLTLTDSGFRINADGLVARVQISLGAGGGFGGGVGLGFTASSTLSLNTTGRVQTLGSSTVETGFLLHIDGSIDFLGIATGTGVLDVRVAPNGFELTFALKFALGPLTFDASGGAAVYGGSDPGFAMRLQIHASADALVFSIDASGTMQLNTRNATTIGIAGKSFVLDVNGTVSILKVFTFDAGMHFEIGREVKDGPQKKGAWFFTANAGVDFFGLASLSGTIFLNSDGDFDLQLAGFMQLGSSSFGLRGDFSIGITSIHETTPVEYYYFRLAGSASVRVRAFGVTLVGLGIGFEFEFDTRNIGMDGRVPIVLSVHIEVDLWLFSVSADASFTIGYLQFPKPTYMGSNGSGTLRVWNAGDRILVLNVGDQAHRTARNIGTDAADIHENVLIEQVGSGPDGATIKVSAFGRSNTYEHVTSITGNFADGNDIVTVAPGVTVPVIFSAGSGSDAITFAGTGGATLSGDEGIDSISVTGGGNATVNGGADGDFLEHDGTGTVVLNGGDGNDVLTGSSLTDVLNGDGDGDALQGLAGAYNGGAGNDNLYITLDTNRVPVITGGDGSDVLTLTLSGGADTLVLETIALSGQDGVRLGLNGVDRDTSGLERLLVDAGTGGDTITVGHLASASVTEVSIDVGTGSADTVVVLGSSAAETVVLTYVTRAGRPANEVSVSGIGGYGVFVGRTVRVQGDTIEIRAGDGADTVDASALTGVDRVAVVLRGEGGNDRLIGTPFDDVLDGGDGNDRVTGGAGRDTFADSSGLDTLVESFDSDFGLYDNLFVVGTAAGNGVDFTSGVVEDLAGIFEAAEISGGAGANRFLVGDADGSVTIGSTTRTASPWTGTATLTPLGDDDVVRVELRGAIGTRVHIDDSAGTDRLEVWGTSLRDDLVVDVVGGRGQVRRVLQGAADQSAIDHLGVDLVEIRTLAGGDRVAVRRIDVEHRVELGEGDDLLAVGTQAAVGFTQTPTATTPVQWPNTGGLLDDIDAALTIDGGSGPGAFSGLDIVTVDDTGDTTANTGTLTSTTITGLGLAAAGITYLAFEDLTIALGSGADTFTVDSTHAGAFRPTTIRTNAGADLVVIRTISGPLAVDTGSENDTVRVSSTATGIGGSISGITALLTVQGGSGTDDRLFVDDVATTGSVIGVLDDHSIHGLGMTLGGSAPRPSLVQVVTVQGAADGRFTLTVAGLGTTATLDFDASAATVRRALEALAGIDPGDVVVARAGGRWTVTWAGALAGEAGWTRLITLDTVASYPLTSAGGPAVVTSVTRMTDGYLGYGGFEALELSLGSGDDVLTVDQTHAGTTTVNAGPGADRVFVEAVSGATRVNGQAGADWLVVNAVPDAPGTNPMDGQRLTLDGGTGSDTSVVGLWGVGNSRIDVTDTGYDGGTNTLYVEGPGTSDTFLLRSGLVALLSARGTDGRYAAAEKVTYTDGINGSVVLNGNAGDDTFALDDTSTVITVNGGTGNDRFRIGQLFTSYTADAEFGIPAAQFFSSTRGLLSNGISFPAVLNGGSGDDVFEVFRNRATLTLNGDAGDDTFVVRTFVAESAVTAVNAGQGRDFIQYATNAPGQHRRRRGQRPRGRHRHRGRRHLRHHRRGHLRRRPLRLLRQRRAAHGLRHGGQRPLLRRLDQPRRRDQHLRRPRQRPHRGRRPGPRRAGRRPARPHRPGPPLRREHRRGQHLDHHPGRRHRRGDPRRRRPRPLGRHHRRHRRGRRAHAVGDRHDPGPPDPGVDHRGRGHHRRPGHRHQRPVPRPRALARRHHLADLGHPRLRGRVDDGPAGAGPRDVRQRDRGRPPGAAADDGGGPPDRHHGIRHGHVTHRRRHAVLRPLAHRAPGRHHERFGRRPDPHHPRQHRQRPHRGRLVRRSRHDEPLDGPGRRRVRRAGRRQHRGPPPRRREARRRRGPAPRRHRRGRAGRRCRRHQRELHRAADPGAARHRHRAHHRHRRSCSCSSSPRPTSWMPRRAWRRPPPSR